MQIYRGWTVVAVSLLAGMLVVGATMNTFGLYVIPVSEEWGLSRATMNTAFVLISVGSGVMAPFLGRMLDRYPARPIMAVSALSLGAGFVILGLSHSLWLSIFALAVLLPIGIDGAALLSTNVLVAKWFNNYLARAMALAAIGLSLGAVVVPPLTATLIAEFGWRTTLMISGVTVTALLLLMVLIIREQPGPNDVEPALEKHAGTGAPVADLGAAVAVRVSDILRSGQFWVIGLCGSLCLAMGTTIVVSMVPIAVERGISPLQATGLMAMSGVTAVVAKLVLACFADKIDRLKLLACIVLSLVPLNALLVYANQYFQLLGCAAILGAINGMTNPLVQTIQVKQFGIACYGTVRGLTAPIAAVTMAISMRGAGELYDRTGSYTPVFVAFIVISIAVVLMVTAARPRRAPRLVGAES